MNKKIFKAIMIATFMAFTCLSAVIVKHIHNSINSAVLASNASVPRTWSEIPAASNVTASLDVSTSDTVAIYIAMFKNASQTDTAYLTNLASFIDEAHGSHDGFLPLNAENAEYSYDSNAWSPLDLSAPQNGLRGFRLANNLALGPAGSNTDTLFVRFQVSPSADEDVLSNKLAALLDDGNGNSSMVSASASVAIHIEDSFTPMVVAADTPSGDPHAIFDQLAAQEGLAETAPDTVAVVDDDSGESAFARPLGVSEEYLDLKTVASVANTSDSADDGFLGTTSLILVGILAIFAIAFVGYIVVMRF